jgi:hypothetical protein
MAVAWGAGLSIACDSALVIEHTLESLVARCQEEASIGAGNIVIVYFNKYCDEFNKHQATLKKHGLDRRVRPQTIRPELAYVSHTSL